jgi:hypothetical protein
MKTRRNGLIASLAIAAALALSGAGVQAERFGRDSVYAVPGKTVATKIVANAQVTRYGRDSVYDAAQAPAGSKTIGASGESAETLKSGRS